MLQRPQNNRLEATQVAGALEHRKENLEARELERISVDIAAGECLSSTSPAIVLLHEEEITMGEQEGPSETISMTEPTIQSSEGVIECEEKIG